MDVKTALRRLEKAKQRKLSWVEIGKKLQDLLESSAWQEKYKTVTTLLDAVAETSGIRPAEIRRIRRAYRFFEKIKKERPQLGVMNNVSRMRKGLYAPVFVDLLERLHKLDRDAAYSAIADLQNRSLSFRELEKRYKDKKQASAERVTRPTYRDIEARELEAVRANLERLCGDKKVSLHSRRYRFYFLNPDIVAIRLENHVIEYIDAFEFRRVSPFLAPRQFSMLLAHIVFSAMFFRRYWFIAEAPTDYLENLARWLKKFRCNSVGIAQIKRPPDLGITQFRRPMDIGIEEIKRPLDIQFGILDPTERSIRDCQDIVRDAVYTQGLPDSSKDGLA